MRFPRSVVEEIANSIDLVDYVEVRGVDGKRQGGGFKARCPFHDDSTPSFSIPAGKQYFKCFGCEAGGDIFTFIMMYDKVPFPKAVEIAASYAGIELPEADALSPEEIEARMEREKLNTIYMAAANYCNKVMPPDIREHLRKTYGLTDEFIDEKKVGYDDGNLFNFLYNELGFSKEDLLSSGLFIKTQSGALDFFKTRIVFWYWKNGFPVYAIGRETEYTRNLKEYEQYEKGKYKKLLSHNPETRPYISREVQNKFIYNEEQFLNAFNRPEYGVITEGITDAMLAEQKGIPVMSPVTKQFRKEDLERLKRIARFVPVIYIVNDNEENESGLKGAEATAKELSSAGINAYITTIPRPPGVKKVDLNDFLKTIPDEAAFRKFLAENSVSYLDYLIAKANEHKESGDDAQAQQMINEALLEARHMDPMTREEFFKKIAKQTDIRIGVIRDQFKVLLNKEKDDPRLKESEEYYQDLLDRAKEDSEQSGGHKLYKLLLDKGAQFYRLGGMESTDVLMTLNGQTFTVSSEESPFTMLLQHDFNLNYLDHQVKKMIFEMKSRAYYNAAKIKKQTWLYCDKENRTLYLPIGYEDPRILKISTSGIDIINNGEDKGIFVSTPGSFMLPWKYDPTINKNTVASLLLRDFVENAPCKPSEALLLLVTAFAYPLKRYVDTTPIIKIHGRTSSGKTQLAKAISNIFYGTERFGEMTDASLFDQGSRRMIIILDNIEKIDGRLLEQFLLYTASNGNREIRDKSRDSGTINQMIDCLTILTAIHPFEKVELLNRSFDITTHPKYHKRDRDITLVNEDFRANRDQYLSLWVQVLRESLASLDEMRDKRNIVASTFPRHFKERLNAFYGVMWHVSERLLGWAGWTEKEIQDLVFSWIEDQSKTGSEQEKDISQVYYYFSLIAQYIRDNIHKDWIEEVLEFADIRAGNIVIEATGAQLFTAFSRASRESGLKLPFTSGRQLMARVTNDQSVMEQNGWVVKTRVRRDKGGNYVHQFVCPVTYIPEEPLELSSAAASLEWADEDEGWT